MLNNSITNLIHEEQIRSGLKLINQKHYITYLLKLDKFAEIVASYANNRCRGFIAYYCNRAIAYITLVLVNPLDRGMGLSGNLLSFVLDDLRSKGYKICRLEVAKDNEVAYNLYIKMGFIVKEEKGTTYLMEIAL